MTTVQRIAKNTGVMFISQIMTYLIGFFITMYTARYLGAEGFGILSLALSITAVFGITADLGLTTLMIREVARNKSLVNTYISNTFLMKIGLSALTLGIMFLLVNVIGYSGTVSTVIYLITFSVIVTAFTGVLSAVFQAHEKMEYISVSTILNSISMLVGTGVGIYYHMDVVYFAALYLISCGLVFIYILLMYLWKFSLPNIHIDRTFWKPTIKEAWPFGITSLSGTLYTYIDSIMLSIIQGNTVVGWYSAAYRLMLITLFIPNTVNTAIFPVMSRFYTSSRDSLNLMYERYFKYMMIIGIPMGFGTTLLADKIILLVFGPGYTQSVLALQILIWTMVFTFAGASFVQLLQSINKQIVITKISAICVIINILLNLILIPRYSFIGASFATLLTEVVLVGYIISTSYKLGYGLPKKTVFTDFLKALAATMIMSLFVIFFKNLNLFLLTITAIIVYFISLYILRGVDDVDMALIKELR
ncbi:flippase [Methanobacterium aggregans]|uniref:flippase n=1 Tax=Methanobacterium aggregans TaxID=1615586 RepID=UPI001AEA32C7|nr:flippase [Methanobacterium aggregans]MBP2046882.1 O-antigen/teichoic acid export membrane protein [Methanobacterium aggregans]